MRVAFDIDDTLWKIIAQPEGKPKKMTYRQVPDYDLIQVLRWFAANGDTVFVWSAGGTDYAQEIVNKLGLATLVTVIDKQIWIDNKQNLTMDIAFDDYDTKLAKVDVRVHRTLKDETNNIQ